MMNLDRRVVLAGLTAGLPRSVAPRRPRRDPGGQTSSSETFTRVGRPAINISGPFTSSSTRAGTTRSRRMATSWAPHRVPDGPDPEARLTRSWRCAERRSCRFGSCNLSCRYFRATAAPSLIGSRLARWRCGSRRGAAATPPSRNRTFKGGDSCIRGTRQGSLVRGFAADHGQVAVDGEQAGPSSTGRAVFVGNQALRRGLRRSAEGALRKPGADHGVTGPTPERRSAMWTISASVPPPGADADAVADLQCFVPRMAAPGHADRRGCSAVYAR